MQHRASFFMMMTGGEVLKERRVLFLMIVFVCLLAGCLQLSKDEVGSQPMMEREELAQKEHPYPTIILAAVGDLLIHDRVYNEAKTEDGYDFMPMIESMKPYIEEATVSFANQETMIGGEEIGLSSYPSFNSPKEVGDAVQEMGFDIVSIANNHTLDRGEEAILSAIDHWNTLDIPYVGAYESAEDAQDIRVIETEEGISLAFVAYTYGTNGIPVPAGKDHLVNLIDRGKIAADIAEAKKLADVVVTSLHFGEEYEMMPNDAQKDLVQFVADQGAHIVLGHHPHVLQPVDWVEGKDGNETFVIYSLGNFFSGQRDFEKQTGGILYLDISKDEQSGDIQVHSPSFVMTYVTAEDWMMYPFFELTDEQLPGYAEHYADMKEHMRQWVPEMRIEE